MKAAFIGIIDDAETRLYLLRNGGNDVSSCVLHIHANLTRQAKSNGRIKNVVTAKGYRNRGSGTHLIRQFFDDAWNGGCYKVMLLSGRKDAAVFRTYEKADSGGGKRKDSSRILPGSRGFLRAGCELSPMNSPGRFF